VRQDDDAPGSGPVLEDDPLESREERQGEVFRRDDLRRVLAGFNPWWSGRLPPLPKFRRGMYAACRRHVDDPSERSVLLLSGLRGVGKTTLLLQLAADLVRSGVDARDVLYVGMGHPVLARAPLSEILGLYHDAIRRRGRTAVLLLDEMQEAVDWDSQIKRLVTEDTQCRIVATESVQMIERALVTETQLDRWSAMSAPTLSFYEYLAMRGLEPRGVPEELSLCGSAPVDRDMLKRAAAAVSLVASHFRAYLASGGLPRLVALADVEDPRSVTYEDLVDDILRREMEERVGARNVEDLTRLFVYFCMHQAEAFPVQRYAKLVGASAATVASHVELLERCFLVRRLPPVALGGGPVQKARHRVYVTDTTLRNAQLLRDACHLTDADELRRIVETSVVRHVVERYARTLARVGYWRDARTRREVDLVVEDAGRVVIVQNNYDRAAVISARDCVVHFSRGTRVDRALLVTRDEDDVGVFHVPGIETEFVKAPAPLLTYLLGRGECRSAAE
jgi:uncharacterized protein